MKKIISRLKNIRPLRIVSAFVAVVLLLFTQACGAADATMSASDKANPAKGPQSAEPNSEVYVPKGAKVISPYEGGMNNFSDTDPRSAGAKTEAKVKAEALKENAEQNVIDQTSTVGENTRRILDKKGENVEDLGKNLEKSTEFTKDEARESAEDFKEGTKKGVENIKENTKDAAKGAAENAQSAASDAKLNAQRTAEKAGESVKKTAKEASEKVNDAVQDTVD